MTSGITDPTEAYFKDGTWGWDGTVWRKLPLVWGYYDRACGNESTDNASAGENVLSGDAVPSGEIWVIQTISVVNVDNSCTAIRVDAFSGTEIGVVIHVQTTTMNVYSVWTGEIVLKEGDLVRGVFRGCTLNDNLRVRWWGYKMKIAE